MFFCLFVFVLFCFCFFVAFFTLNWFVYDLSVLRQLSPVKLNHRLWYASQLSSPSVLCIMMTIPLSFLLQSSIYYLSQSYLLKREISYASATDVFLKHLSIFSEAATRGVLWKKMFLQILQYSQESCKPATLLKRDSNTVVLLWILHRRRSANRCFWFFLTAGEQLLLYWLFY